MSDDWAKECAEAHNRKLQEKQRKDKDAQTRREYAEQGAPSEFQKIRERVAQDLRILSEASVTFAGITIQESSDRRFVVIHRNPWVDLIVELHTAMITCECKFAMGGSAKDESKTLRVCSDTSGVLTVYENGGGKAFANTAEISKFILKPLIECLSADALKPESN